MSKDIKEVLRNFESMAKVQYLDFIEDEVNEKEYIENRVKTFDEALTEIKRIIEEAKDITEDKVDYWDGTVQTGIDEYHDNLLKALEG